MTRLKLYESEAALCESFLRWVQETNGQWESGQKNPIWTAYAETAGWDILLVAQDGTQIGIQAKLKFNLKVLSQCLEDGWSNWRDVGPDFRAVLVPEYDSDAEKICASLGLMLITREQTVRRGGNDFRPGLNVDAHALGWHFWNPAKRCDLPEFLPDVAAGASAPVQLTKWKIAALRITARLEVFGKVTRRDFGELRIDSRRWTGTSGWLKPGDVKGEFVRGDALDFDRSHPTVYSQVLAEVRAAAEKQPTRAGAPVTGDLLA